MKIDSRFQTRLNATINLTVDGEPMFAQSGDTVAAALLAHSGDASRESGNGSPRTAFCMMGVCFDCLIEIDGRPNVQSCMTQVREGMVLRRLSGFRKLNGSTDDA